MILRTWYGVVKTEQAQAYIDHLVHDTFPQLKAIKGFIEARILRRMIGEGIEFMITTQWDSMETIHGFAGDHLERAVVPQVAQNMMVRFDETVAHFEIESTFKP